MVGPAEFFEVAEYKLGERFLRDGYVIQAVEDLDNLERIRRVVTVAASRHLGFGSDEPDVFLNHIHRYVSVENLNDFRLQVIDILNVEPSSRPRYYSLARHALAALVGNELAMQLRLNLSIQLPGYNSSLLPVHADVWSGDSPFEVVV